MRDMGGYGGKAAMIPAALGTIGGIQAIQERQNTMALNELKLKDAQEKEAFENQPISTDLFLTQSGFQPGTKAHDYLKSQVEGIAKDGWTTRGQLRLLRDYLKGSEQHTMGFLNAQIADTDEEFKALSDEYYTKGVNVEDSDYKGQQKLKEMKKQLEALDMKRAALKDKRDGTMKAFELAEKRKTEEMKQLYGIDKMERNEMLRSIRELQNIVETFKGKANVENIRQAGATARKGMTAGGDKGVLYEVTYPDGRTFTLETWPGKTLYQSYPNLPQGVKVRKIGVAKDGSKGGSWRSGAGAAAPATNAPRQIIEDM